MFYASDQTVGVWCSRSQVTNSPICRIRRFDPHFLMPVIPLRSALPWKCWVPFWTVSTAMFFTQSRALADHVHYHSPRLATFILIPTLPIIQYRGSYQDALYPSVVLESWYSQMDTQVNPRNCRLLELISSLTDNVSITSPR